MKYTNFYTEVANKNVGIVKQKKLQDLMFYIADDGAKYYVDGKNVILDYSYKEKNIARMLINKYGGTLYMIPRVNNPEGIRTPDFIWNGEKWDLKSVRNVKSPRAVDNTLKKARLQANNFILDITECCLKEDEIIEQTKCLFNKLDRLWIDKIIIINKQEIVKIFSRNKKRG